MCKALNSNAISELSDEYHVRTCRRDELDIWKEMPFDDMKSAKEYNGFMTEYFNDVYGSKEDLFFQKCLFVCDKNDSVEFGLHKKTPCKTKKILQGVFLCSDIYVRPQGRLPCGVDFLCRDYLSLPWDFFLCFD